MNKFTLAAAAAVLMAGVPGQGSAATIFFGENLTPGGTVSGDPLDARNAFLSNLAGVGTEDFEGFAAGSGLPLALTFPGSTGNITANLTGPSGISVSNSPGAGRFATSGTQFLQEVETGFTLSFSAPVAAFGFYGTDIGDFNGQVTVQTSNGIVQDFTINNTLNAPNGSLLFWGIIDAANPFTQVTFGNTNAGTDIFGFDDLTVGDVQQVRPTPVPGTLALTALALAGLGVAARRKA